MTAKALPRRVAVALLEFNQALAQLNAAETTGPATGSTIPQVNQRETNLVKLRNVIRRSLVALNYTINHPDMRWVQNTDNNFGPQLNTEIEKGIASGPHGGKPVMRHHKIPSFERLIARPNEIPETIAALKAVLDKEGESKMNTALRPLLPAHWYIPEVLAFTFHWCNRLKIPSFMVICEGSYQRLDLIEHTIFLSKEATPEGRWASLLSYLDQIRAVTINTDAENAVSVGGAIKSQDIFEVIQAFLTRGDWWNEGIDMLAAINDKQPLATDPNSVLPVFNEPFTRSSNEQVAATKDSIQREISDRFGRIHHPFLEESEKGTAK